MEKVALLCVLMTIISLLAERSPAPKPQERSRLLRVAFFKAESE